MWNNYTITSQRSEIVIYDRWVVIGDQISILKTSQVSTKSPNERQPWDFRKVPVFFCLFFSMDICYFRIINKALLILVSQIFIWTDYGVVSDMVNSGLWISGVSLPNVYEISIQKKCVHSTEGIYPEIHWDKTLDDAVHFNCHFGMDSSEHDGFSWNKIIQNILQYRFYFAFRIHIIIQFNVFTIKLELTNRSW